MNEIKNLVAVFGLSGSGKSTMVRNSSVEQKLTCTTRLPRSGEKHNVDYLFLTKEEFKNTDMLESVIYGGNLYGTPKTVLHSDNDIVAIVLEIDGIIFLKKYLAEKYPNINLHIVFMDIDKDTIIKNLIKDGYSKKEAMNRFERSDIDKDLEKLKKANINIDLTISDLNSSLSKFEEFVSSKV